MGAAGARTLAMLATVAPAAFVAAAVIPFRTVCRGSSLRHPQRAVRTSGPSGVMAMVCSACAPREPSRLRKVHPSRSV